MPAQIESHQRATHFEIHALFGCREIRRLRLGNDSEREQNRLELDNLLLGTIRQSSIIGYLGEPESGYVYSGASCDFEAIVKTWPEFGTAHAVLDVTNPSVPYSKEIMRFAVAALVRHYCAERSQFVTELPLFLKDPEVRS